MIQPVMTAGIAQGLGALLGGAVQGEGARDAAKIMGREANTIRQTQLPFITSGYGAQSQLNHLLGISPMTAGGGTPGVGGTPFNQSDYDFLNQNWGALRGSEWWNDPNSTPGLSSEGRDYLGKVWSSVSPAANFTDPNWHLAAGGPAYAAAAGEGEGGAGGVDDGSYGSLLRPFDAAAFGQYKDPGYDFRQRQGEQAVRNAAAAGSGAFSGTALKDLLTFNQELASTEYGNAFNRYQVQQGNIFGRLSDLARLGQSAAAGVGSAGTQLAQGAGQSIANAAGAYGGALVGAGNAAGSAIMNHWLLGTAGGRNVWQPPGYGG